MATPRKSTPAKKSAAKKSASRRTSTSSRRTAEVSENGQSSPAKSLRVVAVTAARELAQLIGQVPEGIVAVEKHDDGWRVQVEVVESHRIPETTDILAVYEVDVDRDGDVISYRRTDRYVRGRVQE